MQVASTFDQANARKYPEQIAIAIMKDPQGKYNPITLGWVMQTSIDPPMLAISIGRTRYSLVALRQARQFVLALPSAEMAKDAEFHGTKSGRDMDKLQQCGTRTQPAKVIDGLLLADAVANFECRCVAELQTGDHVIFVGQVVASHVNEDAGLRRLYSLGNERMGRVVPG